MIDRYLIRVMYYLLYMIDYNKVEDYYKKYQSFYIFLIFVDKYNKVLYLQVMILAKKEKNYCFIKKILIK